MNYIPYYETFGIKTLPRSWAEVLSVNIVKNKTIPGFVSAETISKDCMEQFNRFNAILKQYNYNVEAAKSRLEQEFEKSYWYYILYFDPKVTKVLNNKIQIR